MTAGTARFRNPGLLRTTGCQDALRVTSIVPFSNDDKANSMDSAPMMPPRIGPTLCRLSTGLLAYT